MIAAECIKRYKCISNDCESEQQRCRSHMSQLLTARLLPSSPIPIWLPFCKILNTCLHSDCEWVGQTTHQYYFMDWDAFTEPWHFWLLNSPQISPSLPSITGDSQSLVKLMTQGEITAHTQFSSQQNNGKICFDTKKISRKSIGPPSKIVAGP